jgi:hypothetical protein
MPTQYPDTLFRLVSSTGEVCAETGEVCAETGALCCHTSQKFTLRIDLPEDELHFDRITGSSTWGLFRVTPSDLARINGILDAIDHVERGVPEGCLTRPESDWSTAEFQVDCDSRVNPEVAQAFAGPRRIEAWTTSSVRFARMTPGGRYAHIELPRPRYVLTPHDATWSVSNPQAVEAYITAYEATRKWLVEPTPNDKTPDNPGETMPRFDNSPSFMVLCKTDFEPSSLHTLENYTNNEAMLCNRHGHVWISRKTGRSTRGTYRVTSDVLADIERFIAQYEEHGETPPPEEVPNVGLDAVKVAPAVKVPETRSPDSFVHDALLKRLRDDPVALEDFARNLKVIFHNGGYINLDAAGLPLRDDVTSVLGMDSAGNIVNYAHMPIWSRAEPDVVISYLSLRITRKASEVSGLPMTARIKKCVWKPIIPGASWMVKQPAHDPGVIMLLRSAR